MDLINLLQVMNKAEMKRAEAALGLITKRGYQRGRDLGAAWKDLLAKQKG